MDRWTCTATIDAQLAPFPSKYITPCFTVLCVVLYIGKRELVYNAILCNVALGYMVAPWD